MTFPVARRTVWPLRRVWAGGTGQIHVIPMRVSVIGTGYVGLVSGACLAELGHDVVCVDVLEEKIEKLRRGIMPIYEAGLEEVVGRAVRANRLRFTTSFAEAIPGAEVVVMAIGTPSAL